MTDEELTEALDLLDRLTEGLLPLGGPFQVYRERVDTWKKMMRDKLAPQMRITEHFEGTDHPGVMPLGQGDVARVPTECPHCHSALVTKNWPKGSENFYQWCEKCRCTVVFVPDDEEDEEDDVDAADESCQMYTTHKAQDEEKTVYEPRNEISDRWYPR
jgi:hypothetical protein